MGEDGGMGILKLGCDGTEEASPGSASSVSPPENSDTGDIIFAKNYRVASFTEAMTDGPRITVDGRLYYYPTSKLPCGRDLTVVFEDGSRGTMNIRCN